MHARESTDAAPYHILFCCTCNIYFVFLLRLPNQNQNRNKNTHQQTNEHKIRFPHHVIVIVVDIRQYIQRTSQRSENIKLSDRITAMRLKKETHSTSTNACEIAFFHVFFHFFSLSVDSVLIFDCFNVCVSPQIVHENHAFQMNEWPDHRSSIVVCKYLPYKVFIFRVDAQSQMSIQCCWSFWFFFRRLDSCCECINRSLFWIVSIFQS